MENNHLYETAPGTNSQQRFYRSVIDLTGIEDLSARVQGQSQTIQYQLNEHPIPIILHGNNNEYQRHPTSLSIVIFIQNMTTKEIYQSINVPLRGTP